MGGRFCRFLRGFRGISGLSGSFRRRQIVCPALPRDIGCIDVVASQYQSHSRPEVTMMYLIPIQTVAGGSPGLANRTGPAWPVALQ